MKKTIFLLVFILFIPLGVNANTEKIYSAADNIDMSAVNEMLGSFSFEELAKSIAQGEGIPFENYGRRITAFLLKEVKAAVGTLMVAVAFALICTLIGGLCFNQSSANITFFVCYTVISGVALSGFSAIADMARGAAENMTVFMSAAIPCFGVLGMVSGKVAASMATTAPVMLLATVSGYIIKSIAIPAVFMSLAIGIVGNLKEKQGLEKLGKLIRKTALWIVCGVETLFCAVIGITDFLTNTLDKVAGKTAKFAVSSTIPVVGGILSDVTDALASSGAIIKNTAGVAGMILIFMIIAIPVLKTAATLFAYKICAALTQPVADKRITAVLSDISEVLSTLSGMLIAVGAACIISVALLLGGVT